MSYFVHMVYCKSHACHVPSSMRTADIFPERSDDGNTSSVRRLCCKRPTISSLRASSPVWASEASLARTRERAAKRVLARLASLAQIGELARRLNDLKFTPLSERASEQDGC